MHFAKKSGLLLVAIVATLSVAAQPLRTIDSLKQSISGAKEVDRFVHSAFLIADNFMEIDQYDSAQLWLNRIVERLPLKEPSLANYFLSTRQAEVYYYNGLQRLGLQESERSLAIAKALKDSLLLADSYNFLGLFYTNLDSAQRAIPFFRQGIRFNRQPPYPAQYLSLSKPHHLYGNLGEAYEKLMQLDSAQVSSRTSLKLASEIGADRGIAIAHNNLGNVFIKTHQPDSALLHYQASLTSSINGKDFDVELLNYGGIALAHYQKKDKQEAISALTKGFDLIQQYSIVNDLFLNQFLDNAVQVYSAYGMHDLLAKALRLKGDLLHDQMVKNNLQMTTILNAGLQNETRLLSMQVKEAAQSAEIANTRLYLLIALFVLLGGGFMLYRYRARQKLALVGLQNRISQDLHDDVGSSLSSLQLYSTVAMGVMEKDPAKSKEMLQKISQESVAVLENIGDIVWSMKAVPQQSMVERIKNFAADVLGASNLNYSIDVDEEVETLVKKIEARKNILLITKEAINNAVKYSRASNLIISLAISENNLNLKVADDGIGFAENLLPRKGDGLANMQKRTKELGGTYKLTTSLSGGTTIAASFPLTKISDSL